MDFFADPEPLPAAKEESESDSNDWSQLPAPMQQVAQEVESMAVKVDQYYVFEQLAIHGLLITTIASTCLIVYFKFSFAWLIVLLYFVNAAYQKTIQRFERKVRRSALIEYSIHKMDADLESVEWLNSFMTKFWVNYEPELSRGIQESIDVTLDVYKPSGFDELRLTHFTLGSQAPRIDSIKTFANTEDDVLIMDIDLSFVPVDNNSVSKNEMLLKELRNVNICILAKIGLVPLNVSLKEFCFTGKMRVQLRYMNTYPHIKVIDIAFLAAPEIDFILKPLGAMDINKFGSLGDTIKQIVAKQLSAIIVNPIKLSFPIGEWMNGGNDGDEPVGVLRISLIEAKGIKNVDVTGISDPCALIKIGGVEVCRTRVIDNTLDPKWSEIFHLVINKSTFLQIEDLSDELKIEILHTNQLSTKSLGTTSSLFLSKWVKLLGIPNDDDEDEQSAGEIDELLTEWGSPFNNGGTIWKKIILDRRNHGQVKLKLSYFPIESQTNQSEPAIERIDNAAILKITIHQAKELGVGTHGVVDVAIFTDSGVRVFKTPARKRTSNPLWEFKHTFYSTDIKSDEYLIIVYNKGHQIGEVRLNIKNALQSSEDWYKLYGRGKGKIRIGVKSTFIDINQTSSDPSKAMKLDAIGVMRINVRDAKNLVNAELLSKSDPYVKLMIQGRPIGATNVQKSTLNPIWNETFYTIVYNMKESLKFEVYDSNNLSKDVHLGKSTLELAPLFAEFEPKEEIEGIKLGLIHQDGMAISIKNNKTIVVSAPLYRREEKLAKPSDPITNSSSQGPVGILSRRVSHIAASLIGHLKDEKLKHQGNLGFELDFFPVVQKLKVIPADKNQCDVDEIQRKSGATIIPESSPMLIDRVKDDMETNLVPRDKAEIIKKVDLTSIDVDLSSSVDKHKSGILSLGIESGQFDRKRRPYLEFIINDEVVHLTAAPFTASLKTYWHSRHDHFVADLSSSKVLIFVKEQTEEKVRFNDEILGWWTGNFILDLLGKGNNNVIMRQYVNVPCDFKTLPQTCSVNLSFGFAPVDLDFEISESTNMGILHLDILSCADLSSVDSNGLSDPYCLISLNGKIIHKTKTHHKTLHPEFEEGIQCDIFSRLRSTIFLEVKDYNQFSSHSILGTYTLPLVSIKSDEVTQLIVPIEGKSGSLTLRYWFEPKVMQQKFSPLDANDSKMATETTSIGKFGRGLTTQVTGLGSKIMGGKKSNYFSSSLFAQNDKPPNLNAPEDPEKSQRSEVRELNQIPNKLLNSPKISSGNLSVIENNEVMKPTSLSDVKSRSRTNSSIYSNTVTDSGKNITICIKSAHGLKAVDSNGLSDPYVKVYHVMEQHKTKPHSIFRTSVIKRNLDPVFNQSFTISSEISKLKFSIFDKNIMSSDVSLGYVLIDMSQLMNDLELEKEFQIIEGPGILIISCGQESKHNATSIISDHGAP